MRTTRGKLLVRPHPEEDRATKGGLIILTDYSKSFNPKLYSVISGDVIAVGSGIEGVRPGDIIYYHLTFTKILPTRCV